MSRRADSRGALRRLRHQTGRRGAFLLFLAVLDAVYGYYLIKPPGTGPPWAHTYPLLPEAVWGWWWILTAAACLGGAFMESDRVAYGAASLLETAWALRFAYLWYRGFPLAWVSLMVWLVFAATVMVVAGWSEDIVNLPTPAGDRDR